MISLEAGTWTKYVRSHPAHIDNFSTYIVDTGSLSVDSNGKLEPLLGFVAISAAVDGARDDPAVGVIKWS